MPVFSISHVLRKLEMAECLKDYLLGDRMSVVVFEWHTYSQRRLDSDKTKFTITADNG